MTILFPLFIPALAYFAVLVILAVKKSPKGIGISILFFVLAVAAGYWSIVQSRSSTAALGFLGLPLIGAVAGFLGLAFGRWALGSSDRGPTRILGWLALTAAAGLAGFAANEGLRTRARHASRDQTQAAFSAEIYRNRELIARGLASNPGRQGAYLDSSIRARLNDRAFLLAALHNDSISPDVIDTLAISPDRGIALEAIRNSATSAKTLRRVYERKDFPDYFYQALAGHANTPPDILRSIYANPGAISRLDIWFAGNPATPREVLAEISTKTTDEHVISRLVQNPALDCAMLGQVGATLKRINKAATDPGVLRVAERMDTTC